MYGMHFLPADVIDFGSVKKFRCSHFEVLILVALPKLFLIFSFALTCFFFVCMIYWVSFCFLFLSLGGSKCSLKPCPSSPFTACWCLPFCVHCQLRLSKMCDDEIAISNCASN